MIFQATLILNLIALALFTALLTMAITVQDAEGGLSRKQTYWLWATALVGFIIAISSYWFWGAFSSALICLLVISVSGYSLYKPENTLFLAAGTGFFIVSTVSITQYYFLPIWTGLLLALGVLLLSRLAVTSKQFVYSEHIREDALLLTLSLALLISIAPPIEQGWQSARMLNVNFEGRSTASIIPTPSESWLYVLLIVALSAGIIASLLKRYTTFNGHKKRHKC